MHGLGIDKRILEEMWDSVTNSLFNEHPFNFEKGPKSTRVWLDAQTVSEP